MKTLHSSVHYPDISTGYNSAASVKKGYASASFQFTGLTVVTLASPEEESQFAKRQGVLKASQDPFDAIT
jgi:hypothetical protein